MSTKKSHRAKQEVAQQQEADLAQKSVIAEFQAVVEELRDRGMTDIDLHSILNMIFQGWLVAGQPTQEYLELAVQAQQQRKLTEQTAQNQFGLVDKFGTRIGS